MKKRILALLLSVLVVFGILPASAFSAAAVGAEASSALTLDLADGSVVITETGYRQGAAEEESAYVGAYRITQSGAEAATANTLSVSGTQEVILDGVNINTTAASAAAIVITGTVNLTLVADSSVASAGSFAGVQVEAGAELTVAEESTGSITAIGGLSAAGIGGGEGKAAGTIIINGGDVNAIGGTLAPEKTASGAGIGGGGSAKGGAGGTIVINGGTVNAYASRVGAGIGGGGQSGQGGSITITGGKVEATSALGGAGIGGAYMGNGGVITIEGGTVVATGGQYGAGIGGGGHSGGHSGVIAITGGNVETKGGNGGAGIGSGEQSFSPAAGDKISVSGQGTVVNALGGGGAAGIGSGWGSTNALIFITDGCTVTAESIRRGAGIGSGNFCSGGDITISDATVTAIGGRGQDSYGGGAGIGGGPGSETSLGSNITITNSTVIAKGGDAYIGDSDPGSINAGGAGIGGGAGYVKDETSGGVGGNITITNSIVTATGGNGMSAGGGGAGIGGGSVGGVSGNITITGGTVKATGGLGGGAAIGGGGLGGIGSAELNESKELVPVSATITVSNSAITAIGGKAFSEEGDGAGIGMGANGVNVENSDVKVCCGIYSDIAEEYIDEGAAVARHTTAEGAILYCIGDSSVGNAMENAKPNESIEVVKGEVELNGLADKVTVTNSGEGSITVNGEALASGESITLRYPRTFVLETDKTEVVIGEIVTVTVTLKGKDLVGAKWTLNYDTERFEHLSGELIGEAVAGTRDAFDDSELLASYTFKALAKEPGVADAFTVTDTDAWSIYDANDKDDTAIPGDVVPTETKTVDPEYLVEVGKDFVAGKKLIYVYTNSDVISFRYDGDAMYEIIGKYKKDGYAHAFVLVVDAIEGDYAERVAIVYGTVDAAHVLTYDAEEYDLNGSGEFNLRDVTAVYGVYNVNEVTFAEYMSIVLSADINADGVVDALDADAFVQAYNGRMS